ncbi:MAG: hypothetical protein K2L24_02895 [Opitutales bacterium]|nr:hypothetical protein [Opitutales bacterium]
MSTTENEVAEFDFDYGLSSVSKSIGPQQRMKLPVASRVDPSEGKVEEKLKKVFRIGTVDNLVMQLLRPEIQDRSLLSPICFREKIREIRTLLQKGRPSDLAPGDDLYEHVDTLLQEEENKSELLDQYRHTLLLG